MMDTVIVDWANFVCRINNVQASSITYLDQPGFYVFLAGTINPETGNYKDLDLLYIGKTYEQTLRERIPQGHAEADTQMDAYFADHADSDRIVKCGILTDFPGERVSEGLFKDIECCLINRNQPLCNTVCKDNYKGRDIRVNNSGSYYPLAQSSCCQEPDDK